MSPRHTGPPAFLNLWLGGGVVLAAVAGILAAAILGTAGQPAAESDAASRPPHPQRPRALAMR